MLLIIRFPSRGTDRGALKLDVCKNNSQGRTFCRCCCIHSFGSGSCVGICKKLKTKGTQFFS